MAILICLSLSYVKSVPYPFATRWTPELGQCQPAQSAPVAIASAQAAAPSGGAIPASRRNCFFCLQTCLPHRTWGQRLCHLFEEQISFIKVVLPHRTWGQRLCHLFEEKISFIKVVESFNNKTLLVFEVVCYRFLCGFPRTTHDPFEQHGLDVGVFLRF